MIFFCHLNTLKKCVFVNLIIYFSSNCLSCHSKMNKIKFLYINLKIIHLYIAPLNNTIKYMWWWWYLNSLVFTPTHTYTHIHSCDKNMHITICQWIIWITIYRERDIESHNLFVCISILEKRRKAPIFAFNATFNLKYSPLCNLDSRNILHVVCVCMCIFA